MPPRRARTPTRRRMRAVCIFIPPTPRRLEPRQPVRRPPRERRRLAHPRERRQPRQQPRLPDAADGNTCARPFDQSKLQQCSPHCLPTANLTERNNSSRLFSLSLSTQNNLPNCFCRLRLSAQQGAMLSAKPQAPHSAPLRTSLGCGVFCLSIIRRYRVAFCIFFCRPLVSLRMM